MQGYSTQYHTLQGQIQNTANEIVLVDAKITKLKNYLSWLTDANNKISYDVKSGLHGLGQQSHY